MRGSASSVGFVIEGMSGPGSGVWSRFETLVRGLAAADMKVHVLASVSQGDALTGMPFASRTDLPARSRLTRLLARKGDIEHFISAQRLGVVHVESPPFPRVRYAPTIAAIHDVRGLHGRSGARMSAEVAYQRYGLKRQINNVDAVAVLSPWAADEVAVRLDVPRDRIHVIPPVVEAPAGLPDSVVSSRPFALVLGHLEPRKNVATAIRAAASPAWPDGLDLVIAGRDAGEEAELRHLAEGARTTITFLGPVDEARKWQLLRSALVVLVPSLIEGFGIVAVEAPLVGTPVLVADASALPDLAASPTALVAPLEPEEWAAHVNLLATDASARASLVVAQSQSAERFSAAMVIPRVLAMHDAVRRV